MTSYSYEEKIDIIFNNKEYNTCSWFNKKTKVFCNEKIKNNFSYHNKFCILYCHKCCDKIKTNDLIEILKEKSLKDTTYNGLIKVKGTPNLPVIMSIKKEEEISN